MRTSGTNPSIIPSKQGDNAITLAKDLLQLCYFRLLKALMTCILYAQGGGNCVLVGKCQQFKAFSIDAPQPTNLQRIHI